MDPITALATSAGAVAAWKATKPFLDKVAGPAVDEVGVLVQDNVRLFRFRNQLRMLGRAQKMLVDAGVEPRQVPLKTLLPLLEGVSLEDNDLLSDKWAALLASAANPQSRAVVQPSFPELLKQLSATEAILLDKLNDTIQSIPVPKEEWIYHGINGAFIKQQLGLQEDDFDIATENLFRLRLCAPPAPALGESLPDRVQTQTKDVLCLTTFGYAFVVACTPPTPVA